MILSTLKLPAFKEASERNWIRGAKSKRVFKPSINQMVEAFPLFEIENTLESVSAFKQCVVEAAASRGAFGKCLTVRNVQEYATMRMFLDGEGESGFTVSNGAIASLFCHSMRATKGVTRNLLHLAVQSGGNRLDAFDTVLPGLYREAGFCEVARLRWDDSLAPEGWEPEYFRNFNDGKPDVVFMVYESLALNLPKEGEIVVATYSEGVVAQLSALGLSQRVEVCS